MDFVGCVLACYRVVGEVFSHSILHTNDPPTLLGVCWPVIVLLERCIHTRSFTPMIRPPGRGRWHAPSSRHLRALLSVCGGCSLTVWGAVLVVCVCRYRGVVLCRCVCVCDLLIFGLRGQPLTRGVVAFGALVLGGQPKGSSYPRVNLWSRSGG